MAERRAGVGHPRMGGRDPHEPHRAATALELFFDLTFVIAFGVASSLLADHIAHGELGVGLLGFAFAMFAVIWAWINFSWFASAYDTDDWVFRLVTMVQMVGVLILSMGLAPMFASLDEGAHVDNRVMVLGYVVMRVALVFQWLRAAAADPARRATCLSYAKYLALAQVGWVAVIVLDTSIGLMFALAAPLFLLEMAAPLLAERRAPTPWHAHHIAERYGLLLIITLGETLLGAIEALRAVVATSGWTLDTAVVGLAGTGLAFALWWLYFTLPAAAGLHRHREKGFVFGYLHIVLFSAIAAAGAGLHVYGLYLHGEASIGEGAVTASIAVPVAVFMVCLAVLQGYLDTLTAAAGWLLALLLLVSAGAVALAAAGGPLTVSLLLLLVVPALMIVRDVRAGRRGGVPAGPTVGPPAGSTTGPTAG